MNTKFILAGPTSLFLLTSPAMAVWPWGDSAAEQTQAPQAPASVKSELDELFANLNIQLKKVDEVVARAKSAANRTPGEVTKEVENSSQVLSALLDKIQPTGDMMQQVAALRAAAVVHRRRISDMSKEILTEEDKNSLLMAWDKNIRASDEIRIAMDAMRINLQNAVTKLRMKSAAISEMVLADEFRGVFETYNNWIKELQGTLNNLHRIIQTPGS
jgi:hypothetical protein